MRSTPYQTTRPPPHDSPDTDNTTHEEIVKDETEASFLKDRDSDGYPSSYVSRRIPSRNTGRKRSIA